jgi:hypothetical protein
MAVPSSAYQHFLLDTLKCKVSGIWRVHRLETNHDDRSYHKIVSNVFVEIVWQQTSSPSKVPHFGMLHACHTVFCGHGSIGGRLIAVHFVRSS